MKRIIIGIVVLLLCFTAWLHTKSETPEETKEVQTMLVSVVEKTIEPTIIPTPTPELIPELPEYNIPLDKDLQQYIWDECKAYDIDYDVVIGLIKTESNFNSNLVYKNTNGTQDIGLMQINSFNHKWLSKELGITNFFDPYQNIKAGLYMLSIAYQNRNDYHLALMEYNTGSNNTNKLISRGITSSVYSRRVIENKNKIIESGEFNE